MDHNPRLAGQAGLIAVMVTAVITGLATVIHNLAPGQPWLAIPVLILFVTLEAIATTFWLRHRDQLIVNHTNYRLAEFVVLLLVSRLFSWALIGNWPKLYELRNLLLQPSNFFDGYFSTTLLLILVSWGWSIGLATLFYQLRLSRAEIYYYRNPLTANEGDRPLNFNRARLVETFFQQWVWGGIFLGLFAAMTTVDLTDMTLSAQGFSAARFGLLPHVLFALLAYFLAGFTLLSQARLCQMQARWLTGRIKTQEAVGQQWQRNSTITLLIIAVLATFIPIGSTVPIGRILSLVLYTIAFIINFLFFFLTSLFFGVMALLGRPGEVEKAPEPPQFTPNEMPPLVEPGAPPSETTALVLGAIFWVVVTAVVIIALIFFLRERGYKLKHLRQLWRIFTNWLRQLWHGTAAQISQLRLSLPSFRQNNPVKPEQSAWHFIRVNALSPRDKIRYFYLSIVRRASEKGLPRPQSSTPLEYADKLAESWPEAEEEMTDLTVAFLKARYSPKRIEEIEANTIKGKWKQIRQRLRRKKS
jgi:hypothetical protein